MGLGNQQRELQEAQDISFTEAARALFHDSQVASNHLVQQLPQALGNEA
jgi:hypothetical protein